jgi:hypothetical protein
MTAAALASEKTGTLFIDMIASPTFNCGHSAEAPVIELILTTPSMNLQPRPKCCSTQDLRIVALMYDVISSMMHD